MLQDENKNYIDTLKNYDSKFKDSVEYIEKIIKEYSDEKFVKGKNENEIRAEVWMMISESMGCNVAK